MGEPDSVGVLIRMDPDHSVIEEEVMALVQIGGVLHDLSPTQQRRVVDFFYHKYGPASARRD